MPKVQFCHNVYFLPFHCCLVLQCTHTHTEKRIKKVECENGSNPLQTWPIPTACHLDLYLVWHDDLNGDTPATCILNVLMGGKIRTQARLWRLLV